MAVSGQAGARVNAEIAEKIMEKPIHTQSVTVEARCPRCGMHCLERHVQVMMGDVLFWEEMIACDACGQASCLNDDARGNVRDLLLAEHGRWGLVIGEDAPVVMVLKVFKQRLGYNHARLRDLMGLMPGRVAEGTRIEMLRLCHLLHLEGVEAEVVAVEG